MLAFRRVIDRTFREGFREFLSPGMLTTIEILSHLPSPSDHQRGLEKSLQADLPSLAGPSRTNVLQLAYSSTVIRYSPAIQQTCFDPSAKASAISQFTRRCSDCACCVRLRRAARHSCSPVLRSDHQLTPGRLLVHRQQPVCLTYTTT